MEGEIEVRECSTVSSDKGTISIRMGVPLFTVAFILDYFVQCLPPNILLGLSVQHRAGDRLTTALQCLAIPTPHRIIC